MNHVSKPLEEWKYAWQEKFVIKEGEGESLKAVEDFKDSNPIGWNAYMQVIRYTRLQDLDKLSVRNGVMYVHLKNGWVYVIVWNTPMYRLKSNPDADYYLTSAARQDENYQYLGDAIEFGLTSTAQISLNLQSIMDK